MFIPRSRMNKPYMGVAPLDGSIGGVFFESFRVLENHDILFKMVPPDDKPGSIPVLAIFMRGYVTERWDLMMLFHGVHTIGLDSI